MYVANDRLYIHFTQPAAALLGLGPAHTGRLCGLLCRAQGSTNLNGHLRPWYSGFCNIVGSSQLPALFTGLLIKESL